MAGVGSPTQPEVVLEAATNAFRQRDPTGRILPAPAWRDLSPQERETLFDRQLQARWLERGLADDGLSSTLSAVMVQAWQVAQLEAD